MRWCFAVAMSVLVAANVGSANALGVNSADAGIQVATARPHEIHRGAMLYTKTGQKLGVVVRVAQGKRGYIEDVYVRDMHGVIRRIPALSIYKRHGGLVTPLTPAQFTAVPQH